MVRNVKRFALAGAFLMVAAPAFAQVPPQINPLGIDLDPFHLFTPAPAMAPAAPMAEPMMRRPMHRRMMHRSMMRKPMMHHSMMHHSMMKKPMMKKPMMAK